MPDREQVLKAASKLEDIAMLAKIISNDLRAGAPGAYARVYWLRWCLGKTVATLGVGVPDNLKNVGVEYEQYRQK